LPGVVVQSEKRHIEEYRFFQKLRKVPVNQLIFNYSARKPVAIILTSLLPLDIMIKMYSSPSESF
jgi:hypothetical protein